MRHPVAERVERARHPRRRAGDVDGGVPLALQRRPVGVGPVEVHERRAVGHRAGLPARRAGDVVAAGERVGRDRAGEELGATEDEEPHVPNLAETAIWHKPLRPRQTRPTLPG